MLALKESSDNRICPQRTTSVDTNISCPSVSKQQTRDEKTTRGCRRDGQPGRKKIAGQKQKNRTTASVMEEERRSEGRGGGCESQGWMVESREEQKPGRMKTGSKANTVTVVSHFHARTQLQCW